jgi:environmental stress-induced protein Ves
MRIIPASSYKRTTWKNGGGTTYEIARDLDVEDFGWRISIAEVNSDGPFSLFTGYQRCLTVTSGSGMVLRGLSNSIDAKLHQPVWFSGSETITGCLVDGPCLDFNVIFDPKRFNAEVRIVTDAEQPVPGKLGDFTALYQLSEPPSQKPDQLVILETPDDTFNIQKHSKAIVLRLSADAI